jgi:hypothetical protein
MDQIKVRGVIATEKAAKQRKIKIPNKIISENDLPKDEKI